MKETKAMKYNLKNKLRNLACVSLLTGGMWGLSTCSDYLDVVPDNVGTIEHSFSNRNEAENICFPVTHTSLSIIASVLTWD